MTSEGVEFRVWRFEVYKNGGTVLESQLATVKCELQLRHILRLIKHVDKKG